MIAGKTTNPGWPDPTDWVERLHRALAERSAIYDRETDPLLRRNKAAGMLLEVISALKDLPKFQHETVHFPLKDFGQMHRRYCPVRNNLLSLPPFPEKTLRNMGNQPQGFLCNDLDEMFHLP